MKWAVLPPAMPANTSRPPDGPRGRTALFARVWPARKLMLEETGRVDPEGKSVKNPGVVGPVTVMLAEIALAVEGIPQWPVMSKVRAAPELRAGPPSGPVALRVSSTRQGAIVYRVAGGGAPGLI